MSILPSWLPPKASVKPWTENTFNMLYEIFKNDLIISKPNYIGNPVWFFPDKEDGKEVIFWHLTHKHENNLNQRLPDLERSTRLPWISPMIDNSNKSEIMAWDYEEGDKVIKTYVWLKEYDFLIIMKKYKDGGRRLLTSFYIDYPNYKRKLLKKFNKRV